MTRPPKAFARGALEFVVIVVGVLVALAVDSWVSERQDRADEVQYLEQLHEELTYDSDVLANSVIPNVMRGLAALQRVDAIVSGASPFPRDTMSLLLDVLSGRGAQVPRAGTRTTFDELVSTGSLRLITSPTLRASIVDYYEIKDLVQRRIEDTRSGYPELIYGYLPAAPGGALVGAPSEDVQRDMLRSQGLARAVQVMTAADFPEAITRHQNFLRLLQPMLESVLRQGEELTTSVETELPGIR